MTLARLPAEVRPYFEARLEEGLPDRAGKVMNTLRAMRGGRANDPRFGSRMGGQGAQWDVVRQLFETHRRRLGYPPSDESRVLDDLGPRPAPRAKRQLTLFGE